MCLVDLGMQKLTPERMPVLGMVAIVRYEMTALHARLDESRALGELPPFPIHLHVQHRDLARRIAHLRVPSSPFNSRSSSGG